jgi:3-hydroxyisobutyrate dehydrogenase
MEFRVMQQRVALLGLGAMGSGMAANWLKKGFGLAVYNRTPVKAGPLAAIGARVAGTPRQAAEDADLILAMVADDAASRGVWLGESGALAGARPGAILIESSTVSPDWVRELAGHAAARGCGFLDAPVGGSKPAAAAGQLILFVGGEAATLEKARPALEAISTRINVMGPVGAGATWKLINNMMIAVHIATVSEALVLARRAGFDLKQASALILAGAAASPIVQMKMPRLLEHRFGDTDFALRHMLKDARYAVALGEKLGMRLAMVTAGVDPFTRAEENGLGDLDFSAVLEAVET